MDKHTRNHARFLKYLDESTKGVMRVAQWLVEQGQDVQVNGVQRAPTAHQCEQFMDTGDIDIIIRKRIEVKRLGFDFTCREDWPFPDFIICSKDSWDRAKPKPKAYFILNHPMTHVAIVDYETHRHWYTAQRKDSTYVGHAVLGTKYMCPLSHVIFKKLD